MLQTRRNFLQAGSLALVSSMISTTRLAASLGDPVRPKSKYHRLRPIGFSLYGMKSLPVLQALDQCARIGYDNVEICVMKDFPTDFDKFTPALRRAVKERLEGNGLAASSILIQANLSRAEQQTVFIESIKRAGEISHTLDPGNPPLIETILGGKAEEWEQTKEVLATRLTAWGEAAQSVDILLAVKAHYGHAVNSPDRLIWLYRRVNHPNIVLTYDYSHFSAEGFGLEDSLRAVIPCTRFIHMKDMTRGPVPHYLLPGDGSTDYVKYFRLLKEVNYTGPILVEVSAHIHREPGYLPIPTAEKCFATLSLARDEAYAS